MCIRDRTGEVQIDEGPLVLSRSGETESRDLYGVQVYQNGERFAYGLFDNVSDMHLYLNSGKTYKFVCTLVKDGKDVITYSSDSGSKNYSLEGYWSQCTGIGYCYPFVTTTNTINDLNQLNISWYGNRMTVSNRFSYDSSRYMPYIGSGRTIYGGNRVRYPLVDRYYGETDGYQPDNQTPVTIEMKHCVFGLKYIVTGVTDGTVSITIENAARSFFQKTDITSNWTSEERIICFEDILSAWQYADNYTENLTVSMSWIRGVGVTQNLGSQTIQVKRNSMNILNISLGSDDGGAQIGIAPETTEMGNITTDCTSHF